mgnify:CR=1 FL=1
MEDKSLIIKKLENEGITITSEQCDKLYRFYEMVIEKNKVMNLTAITDYEEFVIKHFVDSLMIAKVTDMTMPMSILDIGTGAGFPGVPIKIVYPETKVLLLDSLNKRLNFLNEVIEELDLKDITTIHSRAEELQAKGEYREDGSADRVEYHMNGNLALKESFSDYYNDIHNGTYEGYYESGQLGVREKYLENGKSIYEEFYPNGRPSLKCNYVNYEDEKLLDGEYTQYYENGNLKANAYYNQNVLEKFVINYPNGVLGFSGDKIKQNAKIYSKNGELIMSFVNGQIYYLNGILGYDPYAFKEEQLEVERILENLPYSNYVAKE